MNNNCNTYLFIVSLLQTFHDATVCNHYLLTDQVKSTHLSIIVLLSENKTLNLVLYNYRTVQQYKVGH